MKNNFSADSLLELCEGMMKLDVENASIKEIVEALKKIHERISEATDDLVPSEDDDKVTKQLKKAGANLKSTIAELDAVIKHVKDNK